MAEPTTEKHVKGRGTGIAAENLQEVLDSAKNASNKGQSQFQTPIEFAKMCARPMSEYRETILDLNAGTGQLLVGSANSYTKHLLAVDIENCKTVAQKAGDKISVARIAGEMCKVHGLFREISFSCDFFALNPPWGLHFYRKNLEHLITSDVDAVREAFRGQDPQCGRDAIDSTIATIMVALDTMTGKGEGFAICNNKTLQRLIFDKDAPHRALRHHIWGRIAIKGNPMTGEKKETWDKDTDFETGVIYFAWSHCGGLPYSRTVHSLDEFNKITKELRESRLQFREGSEIYSSGHCTDSSADHFKAVKEEWDVRCGAKKTEYNIWLNKDGTIGTYLSIFDQKSPKIDKEEAARLNELQGQKPMQLVMQRNQRMLLLKTVNGGLWRVHPDLPAKVEEAVKSYHAVRAPLYPLSPIQSLGYLDESDEIECCSKMENRNGSKLFLPGKKYKIRTQTVKVERTMSKPTLSGEDHEMVLNGQELAIYITDEVGQEKCFMDKRHKREGVTVEAEVTHKVAYSNYTYTSRDSIEIDYILEDIEKHFRIPAVPDVAQCNPEAYQEKLRLLDEIERIINLLYKGKTRFAYKKFQRRDYARASLHAGVILAHATGLGKSLAAIAYPLLKVGLDPKFPNSLVPAEPVLIVAPEHLHQQLMEEWRTLFNIEVVELDSQETFLRLSPLKNGFYISSFTQIASNRIKKLVAPQECGYGPTEIATLMHEWGIKIAEAKAFKKKNDQGVELTLREKVIELALQKYQVYTDGVGKTVGGVKCVYSPSLADLCRHAFGCVAIDEAVKIKGEETIVGLGVRSLEPKFRLVLTATPIKNRLPDIFYLAWWVCGGLAEAHPRWPYANQEGELDSFAGEFLVAQRDVTKEKEEAAARGNRNYNWRRSKRRGTPTAEVCNIHRLWKLLAPVVLRKRKQDIGEDIVPKLRQPIRVPMGKRQADVYAYHLTADYVDEKGNVAMGPKLAALRGVAAAPNSPLLHKVKDRDGAFNSPFDYIPKVAAALTLVEEILRRKEQVVIFSAFQEPLDTLARRLTDAGIPFDLLDGRKSPKKRGELAAEFKRGLPTAKPVLLAGLKAMAEGHSWHLANNAILVAFDWAYDLFEQAINRIHRLNSPKPVNVYPIICTGTIDRKLESLIEEKGNSAELVLDGQLLGENVEELNLAELLQIAFNEFDPKATLDEEEIEKEWPKLREKLRLAFSAMNSQIPEVKELKIPDSALVVLEAVRKPAKKVTQTKLVIPNATQPLFKFI